MLVRLSTLLVFSVCLCLGVIVIYQRWFEQEDPSPPQFLTRDLLETKGVKPQQYEPVSRPLVINLGLPKSGTTSLYKTLKTLGFSASHWACRPSTKMSNSTQNELAEFLQKSYQDKKEVTCNKLGMCGNLIHKAIFDGKLPFDYVRGAAIAQMDCVDYTQFLFPQIDYLDLLLQKYNDHVFVLTTRETPSWANSVTHFRDLRTRIFYHLRRVQLEGFNFSEVQGNDLVLLGKFKEWHENRVYSKAKAYGVKLYTLDNDSPATRDKSFAKMLGSRFGERMKKDFEILGYRWDNGNLHNHKKGKKEKALEEDSN